MLISRSVSLVRRTPNPHRFKSREIILFQSGQKQLVQYDQIESSLVKNMQMMELAKLDLATSEEIEVPLNQKKRHVRKYLNSSLLKLNKTKRNQKTYIEGYDKSIFLKAFDHYGTLAWSMNGSSIAMAANFDIYGSVIVGIVTAVGGGTVRDLLMG